MRHLSYKQGIIFVCATLFAPTAAMATEDESVIMNGGKNPEAMACISCHGQDGKGLPEMGSPRLSGLPAAYIAKQLRDFKAGIRENALMKPIASALSDEEISTVAVAYAAQAKVNVEAPDVALPVQGSGAWIALRGAWNRNIPECTSCHGPSGMGMGNTFPPLAGQSAAYLEAQLQAWRTKTVATGKKHSKAKVVVATRRNDLNGLMQHIAVDLTDEEIKAVAAYFAGIPLSEAPFNAATLRLR